LNFPKPAGYLTVARQLAVFQDLQDNDRISIWPLDRGLGNITRSHRITEKMK